MALGQAREQTTASARRKQRACEHIFAVRRYVWWSRKKASFGCQFFKTSLPRIDLAHAHFFPSTFPLVFAMPVSNPRDRVLYPSVNQHPLPVAQSNTNIKSFFEQAYRIGEGGESQPSSLHLVLSCHSPFAVVRRASPSPSSLLSPPSSVTSVIAVQRIPRHPEHSAIRNTSSSSTLVKWWVSCARRSRTR